MLGDGSVGGKNKYVGGNYVDPLNTNIICVFASYSLVINCLLNPEACYLFITLVLLPHF